MKMHPMESSNIDAIGYDPVTSELHVRFTSGATYAYSGVEQHVFNKFLAAGSPGGYFAAHVKNKYDTERRHK